MGKKDVPDHDRITTEEVTGGIMDVIGSLANHGNLRRFVLTDWHTDANNRIKLKANRDPLGRLPQTFLVEINTPDPDAHNLIVVGDDLSVDDRIKRMNEVFLVHDNYLWGVKYDKRGESVTMYCNDDGIFHPTFSCHVSRLPAIIGMLQATMAAAK